MLAVRRSRAHISPASGMGWDRASGAIVVAGALLTEAAVGTFR